MYFILFPTSILNLETSSFYLNKNPFFFTHYKRKSDRKDFEE